VEDFILKTGDMIQITITPPAIVPMLMAPVPLVGSSTSVMVGGMPAAGAASAKISSISSMNSGLPSHTAITPAWLSSCCA